MHHDLQTVAQYFEHGIVLNRKVIAAGPIETAFTEAVLQEAYGGRLAPSEIETVRATA